MRIYTSTLLSTKFELDMCTNKGDILADRHLQKHKHRMKLILFRIMKLGTVMKLQKDN